MKEYSLPISEKYTLTVREASQYFSIGIKAMRRLAENHLDSFAFWNGSYLLIIRTKCEQYMTSQLSHGKEGTIYEKGHFGFERNAESR